MKKLIIGVVLVVGLAVGAWLVFRDGSEGPDIEYRYAPVEKGELMRSISATGQLVALTTVDVKSKAGGKVVKLAVDEGAVVKKGDLIAEIDPSDTKALYDQAAADVQAAEARATSSRLNADLQAKNQRTNLADATEAVELAKLRLARAESDAKTQPQLSQAELRTAQASLAAQQEALKQLESVTIPQARKDSQLAVSRSSVELQAASENLKRQEALLEKGFVSQSAVEQARSTLASARSTHESAVQRLSTLDKDLDSQLASQRARVEQAKASLEQAMANQSKVFTAQKALEEARRTLRQAELALQRSRDSRISVEASQSDTRSSAASTVRSQVSLENARVQLDSTTVVAPRDGVVTLKYLEEGTIIPPGTSTFAQGTSLVQISDTTRMFVECMVDEADIAQVSVGQDVKIIVDAYPSAKIEGKVQRVNPAATTSNNITAVKVRVEVNKGYKVQLMPGMNATCEFITLRKKDVVISPAQAIKHDKEIAYVLLKGKDPLKPVRREVKTGESGNDGVEVLEGLAPGEEVVVAEIDLKQLREIQQKMLEAQTGGGLAGNVAPPGGRSRPLGSSGSRTGGARPSGGGGAR